MIKTIEPGRAVHDERGRLRGHLYTRTSDGKLGIRGLDGRPLGYYDPVSDLTKNLGGTPIGTGNILEQLVGVRPPPRVRVAHPHARARPGPPRRSALRFGRLFR